MIDGTSYGSLSLKAVWFSFTFKLPILWNPAKSSMWSPGGEKSISKKREDFTASPRARLSYPTMKWKKSILCLFWVNRIAKWKSTSFILWSNGREYSIILIVHGECGSPHSHHMYVNETVMRSGFDKITISLELRVEHTHFSHQIKPFFLF